MRRRPSPPIAPRPAARRVPRPGARPRSSPTQAASPYTPPDVCLAATAPRLTRPAAILGISAHGLSMRVDAKTMLADAGLASAAVSGSSDPVMNRLDCFERGGGLGETRVSEESTLTQLLKESPFQQLFDLSFTRLERTAGEVEIAMRYTASVERSPGTRQYHGGAIASLIDIAGDYALWAELGYGVPNINIRIDYLRPASDTNLRAQARVRRGGRTPRGAAIYVPGRPDRPGAGRPRPHR